MNPRPAFSMIMLFCVVGCASMTSRYQTAVKDTVLSVVECDNPDILVPGNSEDVDSAEYFKERGKLPYSFEKVSLGKRVFAYRSDLIPCGQGFSGYRHARLFQLKGNRLQMVFELRGPYLFIGDSESVNGRYRLWHWIGDDQESVEQQYYEYQGGKYVKVTR